MSAENKAIVRRILEEIWNKRNPDLIPELFATNYVNNNPNGESHGLSGYRAIYDTYVTAFPDIQFNIESIMGEDDSVATHYTAIGTHQGHLGDIAPTNNRVTVACVILTRLTDGKVVEERAVWDGLSLMQQLGVVPASG